MLHLAALSKVWTERGHFPCLPQQRWRQNQMLDCGSVQGGGGGAVADRDTSEEGSVHVCPEGRMGVGSEASCWNSSLEKMWEGPHAQMLERTRPGEEGPL